MPLFVQYSFVSISCKSVLLIQAWESDNSTIEEYQDDLMDQFTIPSVGEENDFKLSELETVKGEKGIGNFTFIYYNLTNDPNAYDSSSTPADMYCSSSPSPQGKSCQ